MDWTNVLDALIAGLPAIIASTAALLYARRNGQHLRTPSGDTIGAVTERTHDLAAVATLTAVNAARTPHTADSPVLATDSMGDSVRRLNDDAHSPVHVNGEELAS